ncbi:AGAP000461-PA-like protein [Anopheles sinensis]|uniref:AGAP000461-PA-like protein n=1 Tax=Anopheles sinensis TaxID=74873 RepID=A0A084VJD0_ANOSI|nr:AGAP000461-PA-like protein [Anopheles sinensis]
MLQFQRSPFRPLANTSSKLARDSAKGTGPNCEDLTLFRRSIASKLAFELWLCQLCTSYLRFREDTPSPLTFCLEHDRELLGPQPKEPSARVISVRRSQQFG